MKMKRISIGLAVLMLAALACQAGTAAIVTSQPSTPQSSAPT